MINFETLGRPVVFAFITWRHFYQIVYHCLARLRVLALPPVRNVLQRQIYFTGVQALGALTLIALIAGIVITTQITSLVGSHSSLTARILLWTLVRELGPLLSAIVVIARSSTAMASELAMMRIRGELDNLRRLGIDPLDYLIVPRVIGMTVSMIAITFYFQMIAIVAGLGFAALVGEFSFIQSLSSVFDLLDLTEVLASLVKALVFGVVIAGTSCLYGLRVQPSVTDLPRAVTRAVLQNIVMLFLLDAVITYLFFV